MGTGPKVPIVARAKFLSLTCEACNKPMLTEINIKKSEETHFELFVCVCVCVCVCGWGGGVINCFYI